MREPSPPSRSCLDEFFRVDPSSSRRLRPAPQAAAVPAGRARAVREEEVEVAAPLARGDLALPPLAAARDLRVRVASVGAPVAPVGLRVPADLAAARPDRRVPVGLG